MAVACQDDGQVDLTGRNASAEGSFPIHQETMPPPLSGGTLAMADDIAVVADADRDHVYLVDTKAVHVLRSFALQDGAEPGRVVVQTTPRQRAFVLLRNAHQMLEIDLERLEIAATHNVCTSPRGLDVDEARQALFVGCLGGSLLRYDLQTMEVTDTTQLETDIRDVVVSGEHVYVTRFRAVEVLALRAEDGVLVERLAPPEADPDDFGGNAFVPAVAWRTIATPDGGVLIAHQRVRKDIIRSSPTTYYGADGCRPGVLHSTITKMKVASPPTGGGQLRTMPLPIDMAWDAARDEVRVLSGAFEQATGTSTFDDWQTRTKIQDVDSYSLERDLLGRCTSGSETVVKDVQGVALAIGADGTFVVQSREPAMLAIYPEGETGFLADPFMLPLSQESVDNTGHRIFHMDSGEGLACASCHPEGLDDGHVWNIEGIGPRRTLMVVGEVIEHPPFHWQGDIDTLETLMHEVFVERMGGFELSAYGVDVLQEWLSNVSVPTVGMEVDAQSVARGEILFHDAQVGCAACHDGPQWTNHTTVDVGTGGPLQVPSLLGISNRSPLMHIGCADTLWERFDPACGGGDRHGVTSHLTQEQLQDLIHFLMTL